MGAIFSASYYTELQVHTCVTSARIGSVEHYFAVAPADNLMMNKLNSLGTLLLRCIIILLRNPLPPEKIPTKSSLLYLRMLSDMKRFDFQNKMNLK